MSLPIQLDRRRGAHFQEQIYRFIRERILERSYAPGTKLPSTRDLAASLGVSRNTVMLAYDWLSSEGYLEHRAGAGAFVAEVIAEGPAARRRDVRAELPRPSEPSSLRTSSEPSPSFDFWYGRPDSRLFPTQLWRKLANDALGVVNPGLGAYGAQAGDPRLREAIAAHLALSRGLDASWHQVIVTAGAQEALNLVARLFVSAGTHVAVERPGYRSASEVFESFGASLHGVPLDEEGIDITSFRGTRPRLIYVTPSHQFPTGVVMSPARRTALLAYAAQQGACIIEDDYDGEIVFDRPPLAALAALDTHGCVYYVGSFSKSIGPGLRLGYVVVPRGREAAAERAKSLMSYGQSWLDQQTLAAFLEQGHYQRHLRRMRKTYRSRRDAAIEALRATLGPGITLGGDDAGLHLLCALPEGPLDARQLAGIAREAGVGLYALSASGVWGAEELPAAERMLLVGFASLSPEEIHGALRHLRTKLQARAIDASTR